MKNIENLKSIYLQLPKKHQLIITISSVIFLLLIIIPSEKASASRQTSDSAIEVGKRYKLPLPNQEATQLAENNKVSSVSKLAQVKQQNTQADTYIELPQAASSIQNEITDDKLTWQTAKVRQGDSLAKIFKRLGFSSQTTYEVTHAKGDAGKHLKKINIGDIIKVASNQDKQLVELDYPLDDITTLTVTRTEQGFQSNIDKKQVEIREAVAQGTIKQNFWQAGSEAGLSDKQIINLANIFGWDIDFAQDIRKNDSFHIVYEKRYVDGNYIGTGNILAAEFINQNEPFQAIRFTDDEYYTPDGRSMRKAFLRAPVNFRYISSSFKKKRFHPIQKRWKAHNGVDYRAKKGTPVVAAGNGRVLKSTYNKYNGNYVFIQHGNGVVTKYLHFSKRAVKKGQRVKQGQVIGYVGSTGMSQAPHLHYEFLVNGTHRNPRTVKLPDAKPLAKKHKAQFEQLANVRLQQLNGSRKALLAMQSAQSSHGN